MPGAARPQCPGLPPAPAAPAQGCEGLCWKPVTGAAPRSAAYLAAQLPGPAPRRRQGQSTPARSCLGSRKWAGAGVSAGVRMPVSASLGAAAVALAGVGSSSSTACSRAEHWAEQVWVKPLPMGMHLQTFQDSVSHGELPASLSWKTGS